MSYAYILRKVKSDPDLNGLGKNIFKIRRTQKGEMMFELKNKTEFKSSNCQGLVKRSLGESANMRALSQMATIEWRHLEKITRRRIFGQP